MALQISAELRANEGDDEKMRFKVTWTERTEFEAEIDAKDLSECLDNFAVKRFEHPPGFRPCGAERLRIEPKED